MSAPLEIQLIAVMTAAACALPGAFLTLRRMSMTSDAITHTILLGIVLGFLVTNDLTSPLLMVGATLTGVLTVWLTGMLQRTRLVSEDSAVGIVFPLLFSVAIILITRYARSTHLDADSVLLGELAFAPFDRLVVGGVDIGAKGIYIAGALLLINAVFITVFFKELTVTTFDPRLAAILGFLPSVISYALMTLSSLTAVGAFEAVGSVLVVAFMIGPPVTASLLTDDLKTLLFLSVGLGALAGVLGYQMAEALDVSIAGSMAVMVGALFLLAFIFAPGRGLLHGMRMRRHRRRAFREQLLLLHLCERYGPQPVETVADRLHWREKDVCAVLGALTRRGAAFAYEGRLVITEKGHAEGRDALAAMCGAGACRQ